MTATTSVTGVNPSIAGDQVTADFGDLNVNAAVALTITVVPTPAAVSASPLVNTATRHEQRIQLEPQHGNFVHCRSSRRRPGDHAVHRHAQFR